MGWEHGLLFPNSYVLEITNTCHPLNKRVSNIDETDETAQRNTNLSWKYNLCHKSQHIDNTYGRLPSKYMLFIDFHILFMSYHRNAYVVYIFVGKIRKYTSALLDSITATDRETFYHGSLYGIAVCKSVESRLCSWRGQMERICSTSGENCCCY